MTLPPSVTALNRNPLPQQFVLWALRSAIPDVPWLGTMPGPQTGLTMPMGLVTIDPNYGFDGSDNRFANGVSVTVDFYCQGHDALADSMRLGDACTTVLLAAYTQSLYHDDYGGITRFRVIDDQNWGSGWYETPGAVQFTDIQSDVVRTRARYLMTISHPRGKRSPKVNFNL